MAYDNEKYRKDDEYYAHTTTTTTTTDEEKEDEKEDGDDLKVMMERMEKKNKKKKNSKRYSSTVEERVWVIVILAVVMIFVFLKLTDQQHHIMSEQLRFQRSYRSLRKEVYELCTGSKYSGNDEAEIEQIEEDLLAKEAEKERKRGQMEYNEFLSRAEFQQDFNSPNSNLVSSLDPEEEEKRIQKLVDLIDEEYKRISKLHDLILSQNLSFEKIPIYSDNNSAAESSSIYSREEFLSLLDSASITSHRQNRLDDPRRTTQILETNLKLLYIQHILSYFETEINEFLKYLSKSSGPIGRLVQQKQNLMAIQTAFYSVPEDLKVEHMKVLEIINDTLIDNAEKTEGLVETIKSKYEQLKGKFEGDWRVTPLYEIPAVKSENDITLDPKNIDAFEYNGWNKVLNKFYSSYLN